MQIARKNNFFTLYKLCFLCTLVVHGFGCSHSRPLELRTSYPQLPMAPQKPGLIREQYESQGTQFMVASQGAHTSRAAARMLELGGNVIDAAAAASFVISVERPHSTGIGGGGFMLVHLVGAKKTEAIDFRERAPAKARENMFLDAKGEVVKNLSLDTALANGVPGLVAGVLEVHEKYGKLPRAEILKPAIELAETGFPIYPALAQAISERLEVLRKYPESAAIFLTSAGEPLREGDILKQQDLATTLRRIAQLGKAGFYAGPVAAAIVNSQRRHGGLISSEDLSNYKVVWRKPVWGRFKEFELASMPPPSSGGVHVLQILSIVEPLELGKRGTMAPTSIHWLASAMQRAFADRASFLGDPDFVKVPVEGITSKSYATALRNSVHPEIATPSQNVKAGNPWPYKNPYESPETTHFTIMDSEGNTVVSTQTINTYLGSGLIVAGTGILMNNEMDDFSAKPGALNAFGAVGSKNNSVQPGKRPLSSMSPTIVFNRDGTPRLALGTPSGTRIITCVAQTILNHLEHKLPLFESVASLRYHHQWAPDEIAVEAPGFPEAITQKLRTMGHSIRTKEIGCQVNAIAKQKTILHGVADPRGEGMALGK